MKVCHAEFISASICYILKQVQDDKIKNIGIRGKIK